MAEKVDIAELRALLEKATPRPWVINGEANPRIAKQRSPFEDYGAGINSTKSDIEIVVGGSQDEQGGAVGILSNDDAALIVAAVNALPALLAEREQLQLQFEHMRDGRNNLQVERDSLLAEREEVATLVEGWPHDYQHLAKNCEMEQFDERCETDSHFSHALNCRRCELSALLSRIQPVVAATEKIAREEANTCPVCRGPAAAKEKKP